MPTFQTTPDFDWIFPDQAYYMNKHVGMLKEPPAAPLDIIGESVESHSHWAELAQKQALARGENNRLKEAGMLGYAEMNDRSQRYKLPASRSSVPNGVFTGPAMLYSTDAGIRGGRIRTKQGQEWLERRLQERRNEYITMSSGQFRTRGIPAPTLVSPNTNDIDTYLQEIVTSIGTSVIGTRTTEMASKLLSSFFKEGISLSEHQVARYLRIVGEIEHSTRTQAANAGVDVFGGRTQEVRRILAYVNKYMLYCALFLHELSSVINEPENVRQNVINNQRSALLGKIEEAAYPGSSLVPPPQMGQPSPPQLAQPSVPPPMPDVTPRPRGLFANIRRARDMIGNNYADLEAIGRSGEL